MTNESKGIQKLQKIRQKQMKEMRDRGKSWGQIALKFKIDKANARRSVLECEKKL